MARPSLQSYFASLVYKSSLQAQFTNLVYKPNLQAQFTCLDYLPRLQAQFTILHYKPSLQYQLSSLVYKPSLQAYFKTSVQPFFRTVALIGLALIAFGGGGIKPCVSAFGGDQFKLPEQEKLIRVIIFNYLKKYYFECAPFCFLYSPFSICNSQHPLHPSSKQCWGMDPQPIDHERSALTTRPGVANPLPAGIFLPLKPFQNAL